jgi:hypothetical protein
VKEVYSLPGISLETGGLQQEDVMKRIATSARLMTELMNPAFAAKIYDISKRREFGAEV